jgi:type IV pilus assembly protein PilA
MPSPRTRKRARGRDDHGFTLIELLVVVVIIGVLIAIAIPLYLNYRKGANDKSAHSDLRNAVNVLEQCKVDNTAGYPSALAAAGGVPTGCAGQSVKASNGTTFAYFPKSATDFSAYIIGATNSNGSGKQYCYHSENGGSVSTATAVTAWRTTC